MGLTSPETVAEELYEEHGNNLDDIAAYMAELEDSIGQKLDAAEVPFK